MIEDCVEQNIQQFPFTQECIMSPLQSDDEQIVEKQQNVQFSDDKIGDQLIFKPIMDKTFLKDVQEEINLANFLERPIQLPTYTWEVGVDFGSQTFKPWEAFMDNPYVKAKLQNFAFISCNLHVQVKINASPFHYGSMLMAYHPLPKLSPNTLTVLAPLEKVCKSQRPHIWIKPQCNAGGDMVLPFFYYKNFLTISDRTEIQDMGEIDLIQYVGLQVANSSAPSTISIQIQLWASNVVLTGGTVDLPLQSADEYSVAPISRPASAVAGAARMLMQVPVIGPFAKATEIGASAISNIAKIFGYTNVPVLENSKAYKSLPFNGLASSEISEPKDKFTLDPKAELTLDPRTVGLEPKDELAIPYINGIESFLTNFSWNLTHAANDILFNTLVVPSLRLTEAQTGVTAICFTPMSHIAQLFNNWRGDIIFRFNVICTSYHKGRLRVSWDPIGDIVANSDSMNTVFTKVIDLEEEGTNFEFRIPYQQARQWQQTRSILSPDRPLDWQVQAPFTNLQDSLFGNGTLTVRVFTELSAPLAAADVEIMVFVRGAENLEYANPIDLNSDFSHFGLQSSDEVRVMDFGSTGEIDENRYLINYGEQISSIRTLLRRATLADTIPLDTISQGNNAAYVLVNYQMNKFPIPPGPNPDVQTGATIGGSPTTYAYSHMTPFNWMQSAYVASRGSMQWKFNFNANGSSPVESVRLIRSLNQMGSVLQNVDATNGATLSVNSAYFLVNTSNGLSGISLTNQRTQSALAVELNQFNNNRFVSCSSLNTTLGLAEDNSDRETYYLQMTFANEGRNDIAGTTIDRYVNIGTDFNFFQYLNAPLTAYITAAVVPV